MTRRQETGIGDSKQQTRDNRGIHYTSPAIRAKSAGDGRQTGVHMIVLPGEEGVMLRLQTITAMKIRVTPRRYKEKARQRRERKEQVAEERSYV
jgi:hypothetical protein